MSLRRGLYTVCMYIIAAVPQIRVCSTVSTIQGIPIITNKQYDCDYANVVVDMRETTSRPAISYVPTKTDTTVRSGPST